MNNGSLTVDASRNQSALVSNLARDKILDIIADRDTFSSPKDASRGQIIIGVGTVGFLSDVIFPRGNFTDMLLTIKSSEELGILDSGFVEDFDGVDGFMTLRRLSDGLRVSYPAIAVPGETPGIANDVFRITVPLAPIVNGLYELDGRVRDLVGNHTIFGTFASPAGDEDITTLTLEVVDGFTLQYTQVVNSLTARPILEVIGAERAK